MQELEEYSLILNSVNVSISLMSYENNNYSLKFLNQYIINWLNTRGINIDSKALLGVDLHELGHKIKLDKEEISFLKIKYDEARITNKKVNFIFKVKSNNDNLFLQTSIVPILNSTQFIYMAFDITENIKREYKLDSIKKQLSFAQNLAGVGSWELDLNENSIVLSDEYLEVIGLGESKEIKFKLNDYIENFIPMSDLEFFQNRLDLVKNAQINDQKTYTAKIKKPDGEILSLKTISMKFSDNIVRGVSINVSEQIQKQKEIEQNSEYIEALLNSVDLEFWTIDLDYRLKFFNNNHFTNMKTNFNSELTIGKSVFDINKSITFHANTKKNYDRAFRGEWFQETSCIKSGQKERWRDYFFSPLFEDDEISGVLVVAANIDDRKEKENQLIAAEKKLELISENSNDLISIHNNEGLFEFVSNACERIIGYKKDEIIGKSSYEFIHPDDIEHVEKESHKKILEGLNDQTITYRFKHKKQHYIWFETISNIIQEDSESKILTISRDVTERIKYEQELKKAKEIAEKANEFKTKLIASINHEIRTPLNGLLGLEHILKDEIESKKTIELVDAQMRSAKDLLHSINSMIIFSEIESNSFVANREDVELNQFFEQLNSNFINEFNKRDLILTFESKERITVNTDRNILSIISSEIISNSLKYTEKGGLVIQLDASDHIIDLRFIDSGSGIESDQLYEINSSLEKTENDEKGVYDKLGIGLYICKKLSLMINAEFSINSQKDSGVEIVLSLKNDQ